MTLSSPSSCLKSVFGHEAFRPGQEELVQAIANGRDLLGVMATGSGKSLCYQLPAVESGGRCLVISPLISLINDQVKKLELAGVPAAAIHSHIAPAARYHAQEAWAAGTLRFLYVAPERFGEPSFWQSLETAKPDYVVIDEAHCIAQWGHDFRPDYQALGQLKERLKVPIAAFTATATPTVQREIVANLRLDKPLVRVHGFYRPNLAFTSVMEGNRRRRLELVEENLPPDGAAVVYAASRQRVEEITQALQRADRPAYAYHAGLEAGERETAHRHFREDARVVIVATNAFGMGVDRPDVRAVIHAQMPGSVEAYYQEAGRAGRDGEPASCLLLHGPGDVAIHEFFNRKSIESVAPERRAAWTSHKHDQLELMRRYAYSATCRQQALMSYFGDHETLPDGCGRCDNCQTPAAQAVDDATQETVRICLSAAARLQGRFGSSQLADVLTGGDTAAVHRYGHHTLPTYGRLKHFPKRRAQALIQALIRQGYLRQEGIRYPVVSLTEQGREVMLNRVQAQLGAWEPPPPRSRRRNRNVAVTSSSEAMPLSAGRTILQNALRTWRLARARELKIPPYTLFWDRTLDELARRAPTTDAELLAIWGIAEQKRRLFGDELLCLIRHYLATEQP